MEPASEKSPKCLVSFTSPVLRRSSTEAPVSVCTGLPLALVTRRGLAPEMMSIAALAWTSHDSRNCARPQRRGSVIFMSPRSLYPRSGKPISPTSAAPAFTGSARMGSASAACASCASALDSPLVAATATSADRRAAARRFLGGVRLLDRPHVAGIAVERHVVAREEGALVRRDGCARGGEGGERQQGEEFHEGSFSSESISFSNAAPVCAVKPRCTWRTIPLRSTRYPDGMAFTSKPRAAASAPSCTKAKLTGTFARNRRASATLASLFTPTTAKPRDLLRL